MARFTDFDFGLTGLAGQFHQDWTYAGSVDDIALLQLTVEEPNADAEFDAKREAAAIVDDVARLTGSALTDEQIALLWTAATEGNYRFNAGETGRDLLRRIGSTCSQWQRVHGEVKPEYEPGWHSPGATARVREAINGASLSFPEHSRFDWIFGSDDSEGIIAALREALDLSARSASPELAFRLLLRVHLGLLLPVDRASWERYQRLADEFSYGEFLRSSLEFLVDGAPGN